MVRIEEINVYGIEKNNYGFEVISDFKVIEKIAEKCSELAKEENIESFVGSITVLKINENVLKQLVSVDEEDFDDEEIKLNDFILEEGIYYRRFPENIEKPCYLVRFSSWENQAYNLLFNEDFSVAYDFMNSIFGYPYNGPAFNGGEDVQEVKDFVRDLVCEISDAMEDKRKDPLWF